MASGKGPWRRKEHKATLPELIQPSGLGTGASLRRWGFSPALVQRPTYSMDLPETNCFNLPVPVADIKAIVTGKDCPHMKEKSALKQNKVSRAAGLPESLSL